jgi:putative methionine-R-sulfoxide reductase with GAF domain
MVAQGAAAFGGRSSCAACSRSGTIGEIDRAKSCRPVAETRPTFLKLHAGEAVPEGFALSAGQVAGIARLCEGCARLTGYRLHFEPRKVDATRSGAIADFPVIGLANEILGDIRILRPQGGASRTSQEMASRIAASIAGLASELAKAQQALWRREAELAAGVPVLPHREEQAHLAERLRAILRSATKATDCDAAGLYLLDDATSRLKLRSLDGLPPDRLTAPPRPLAGAIADLEALLGHAVVLTDAQQVTQWNAPEPAQSAICLPVSSATMPLGTLWLFCQRPRDFTSHQTELLEIVAGRLAAELERAMLLTDVVESRSARQQIAVAARLQDSQLPRMAPHSDQWEVAGWTAPGKWLASSFHDWIGSGRDELGVFVGQSAVEEPCSSDLRAAMTMCTLRALARAEAEVTRDPDVLLMKANRLLWALWPGDVSASLACGLLSAANGKLRIAVAGSIAVLLLTPTGAWRDCSRSTVPLGGDAEMPYLADDLQLSPGEALLLVSHSLFRQPAAAVPNLLAELGQFLAGQCEASAQQMQQSAEQYLQQSDMPAPACGSLVIVRRKPAAP